MTERWMIVRNADVLVSGGEREGELAEFPDRDVLDALADHETEHEIGPAGGDAVYAIGVPGDTTQAVEFHAHQAGRSNRLQLVL